MLTRDNKFDEFTLPDKIRKINMTHALAWPVSRDESTRIRSRMEEDRTCPSTPNHAMHTLQTSLSGSNAFGSSNQNAFLLLNVC
jgi:hypothetical protein